MSLHWRCPLKWLLIGGSGYVGSLSIPFLKEHAEIRVLDLFEPEDPSVEYMHGSIMDPEAIRASLSGVDAAAYMVLGRNQDRSRNLADISLSYDVSVKGLHIVLQAMQEQGLSRAVYASTLSVHDMRPGSSFPTEDIPRDARDLYGFTKGLGELVCEYFARIHGMTVISLRLNGPLSQEDWLKACRPGQPNTCLAPRDLASAFRLALTAPATGFHTLFISGDYEGKIINCQRAREVLGWEPKERP